MEYTKDLLTLDQINRSAINDDINLITYRRNISKAQNRKSAAIRGLWVFYNGDGRDRKIVMLRAATYLGVYGGIIKIGYLTFQNDLMSFLLLIVPVVVRYFLLTIRANKKIQKNEQCISELNQKYNDILNHFKDACFEQNSIVKLSSGPEYVCNHGDNKVFIGYSSIYTHLKLVDDFGRIVIRVKYRPISNYEADDEQKEKLTSMDKYIMLNDFKKYYSVVGNDQVKCLEYFNPVVQLEYVSNWNFLSNLDCIDIDGSNLTCTVKHAIQFDWLNKKAEFKSYGTDSLKEFVKGYTETIMQLENHVNRFTQYDYSFLGERA